MRKLAAKKNRSRKKVAIFCWRDCFNPRAGGAEYVTLKHAQAWLKKGYQITWFAAAVPGAQTQFTAERIKFYRFGPEKLYFFTAGIMYWLYSNRDFEVIIDQVHGLPNFSTLWAPRTKKILLIHEVAGKIWQYMFPWPLSVVGEFLEATCLKVFYKNTVAWVDAVCTKEDLVEIGFKPSSVYVIPCAIDKTRVVRAKKEKALTLIFLARLVPMKGVEFSLKVFRTILRIQPKAQLWIVGGGENDYVKHLKNLVQLCGMAGQVQFMGKLSEAEKANRLRRAHFLLHTSVKEGFGLTVLEANAQQTPTAIFDVGSLNELVENKKTGVIAPFHDEQALAVQIIAAYKNKKFYAQLAKRASLFQKRYTWDTFVQMSTALLEDV